MVKYDIPTSPYKSFSNFEKADLFLDKKLTYPIVIKANGLAAGKGVKIVNSKDQAKKTIKPR